MGLSAVRRLAMTVHYPWLVMDQLPVEGRYYNWFQLTHSREEFLLSFGQLLPGDSEPAFKVRLVMTATWVQVLHRILGESIEHYRSAYGPIASPEEDVPK